MRNLLILLSMFFLVSLGCNKEESPEPKEEKGLFVLNDKRIKVDGIIYNRYNPNVAKQDTGVYVDTKGEFYVFLPIHAHTELYGRLYLKPQNVNVPYKDRSPRITVRIELPGGYHRTEVKEHKSTFYHFLGNPGEYAHLTVDYEDVKVNVIKKGLAQEYLNIFLRFTDYDHLQEYGTTDYSIKLYGDKKTIIHTKVVDTNFSRY